MIKGIMFWRKCFYLAAIEGLSMLDLTIAIVFKKYYAYHSCYNSR